MTYRDIYNFQERKCFYCRQEIDFNSLTRDHLYPRSKGGKGIRNIVLACRYCNSLKADLTISEFKEKIIDILYFKLPTENENLSIIISVCNELLAGKIVRYDCHPHSNYVILNHNLRPILPPQFQRLQNKANDTTS